MEFTGTITSSKYLTYNSKKIDILKFVLAILVVGIHTLDPETMLRPILRIAVPMFFIISSYLFFLKQSNLYTHIERRRALKSYVIRILKLYLFWFIIWLPLTVRDRGWASNFNIYTPLEIIRGFLFGSTFKASWFLMASLIGVAIVWYFTERKVRDRCLLILGVVAYSFCCLTSSYHNLLFSSPLMHKVYSNYALMFSDPINSFPVSLLFVVLGKILAQSEIYVKRTKLVGTLLLSLIVVYVEFFLTSYFGFALFDDCFFFLAPVSLCLFILVGQSKSRNTSFDTRGLRASSTIIYCSHASIAKLIYLSGAFELFGVGNKTAAFYVLLFTFTLLSAILLSSMLLYLEKRKGLKVLQYSH